jgi:hypothetical protein
MSARLAGTIRLVFPEGNGGSGSQVSREFQSGAHAFGLQLP